METIEVSDDKKADTTKVNVTPEEMKRLLSIAENVHVKDGLPATFVGVSISVRSLAEMLMACERLRETKETDPEEVWDTLRSAWGCLIDRLTDLAMNDKGNIGMTNIQWSAFVMLALYFEYHGDFDKCKDEAAKILKAAGDREELKRAKKEGAKSTLQ